MAVKRAKRLQTSVPGVGCIYKPTYRDKKTGELKHSAVFWMSYQTDDGPVARSTKQRDQAAAFAELVRIAGERVSGQIQDCGPERVTFGQLFDLVTADYQKKSSLKQTNLRIKKHLRPVFGDMKVISLRKADVEAFKKSALKKISPATVNRCLSIMRRSLQLGADHDPSLVIRAIPKWFGKLDEDNVRTGVVTPEMYDSLMPHMAPHVQTAFCIGYHLGMRRGEILSLKWEQVDFERGVIVLEKKQTKGKKARTAPIYGHMRPILEMAQACAGGCPYVVQEDGRRVFDIKTAWHNSFDRAGLLVDTGRLRKTGEKLLKPEALFHDLRRTAATNMIRAKVSPEMILRIVGWKSMAMLRRYGILDEADAVAVGREMETYWSAQRGQTPEPHVKPS
jgi:integrase